MRKHTLPPQIHTKSTPTKKGCSRLKYTQVAQQLGVSKAYISMVMSGKKKPSQRVAEELTKLGVNFEGNSGILSHARLPIPTLPQMGNQLIQ